MPSTVDGASFFGPPPCLKYMRNLQNSKRNYKRRRFEEYREASTKLLEPTMKQKLIIIRYFGEGWHKNT